MLYLCGAAYCTRSNRGTYYKICSVLYCTVLYCTVKYCTVQTYRKMLVLFRSHKSFNRHLLSHLISISVFFSPSVQCHNIPHPPSLCVPVSTRHPSPPYISTSTDLLEQTSHLMPFGWTGSCACATLHHQRPSATLTWCG